MKIVAFIYVFLCVVQSFAQLHNNGATIFVGNNASLYLGDAYSDGIIHNNGTIVVKGDWDNTNEYTSDGRFFLIGENQSFNNNNAAISKMYIGSNSSSTMGNKQLQTSLTITDSLILNSGYLSFEDSIILALSDEGYVSLGNDYSYIKGAFYNYGLGTKYFPIGTETSFLPVELHEVDGFDLLCGIKPHTPFPSDAQFTEGTEEAFGNIYYEKIIANGRYNSSLVSIGYDNEPIMKDGRRMAIIQSDIYNGLYRSLENNIEYESRIEKEYLTSSKPLSQSFFAPGVVILAPWELLFIPNALSQHSPNEEDKAVKVYGNVFSPDNFKFTVSNNWGNIIFETTSLEKMEKEGWNGRNFKTGFRETTGQYNYIINAMGKDGVPYYKAGSIWIID